MGRRNANLPYDRAADGRRLKVTEAAKSLKCSRSWVYVLITRGDLKAFRIGNRMGLQVTEKSLEAYMAARAVVAEGEDGV
ncbi:helix-turn-helix domain-containing protein [Bilophila wadsworthia]|uniref:helix-turn-helix domain-containing protein n=1 Tax=Bilophila wadsworthia TaxID=35833 RepID=UPI003AAE89D9